MLASCALSLLLLPALANPSDPRDLLSADDECTSSEHCALSELQFRANKKQSCHDALPGEKCFEAANWAKTDGIYAHPEWYRGLTAASPFADFQAVVHRRQPWVCPAPCYRAAPAPPPPLPSPPTSNGFLTNRQSRAFSWSARRARASRQLSLAFEGRWPNPFGLSITAVARFLDGDLLASSPFGSAGVLLPWPESGNDQLGDGGFVGYTRRQVCYITAQTFLGARTYGYNSGLARLMAMCPRKGHFRQAFATLLAACAADPTLRGGAQGPLLLAAKAGAAPAAAEVRAKAASATLKGGGLRVCDYDTGAAPLPDFVEKVPVAGCAPRSETAPGVDFMTGGLAGQATQDISAAWFGGYLFDAHACGLGGGQDERLSVYFPEVTVLAYFLSSSHPFPQLRQPVWILGARNFFRTLDGTARFDEPLQLAAVPFSEDLIDVVVSGESYKISSSRPFLVFMSENQGFLGGDDSPRLPAARRNREPLQRDVGNGKFAFEKQVRAWYRSVALSSYSPEVQPALKALVRSIGAGPWLAGLWWGDSQAGFLAVWLGQAIAAETWGQPLSLDYYLYSDFTENPGNQCFLHDKLNCAACMRRCENPEPPSRAYYLPWRAYLHGKPCVASTEDCGSVGLADVVRAYGGHSALELWSNIEQKLALAGGSVARTIFEELLL